MSTATRSVRHGTFVIECELSHSRSRVFAAWADPKAKAMWFAAPRSAANREQGTRSLIDNLEKELNHG